MRGVAKYVILLIYHSLVPLMKIVLKYGTSVMQIGKLHWLFGCGDHSLREVNNWYDHLGQEEGAALERYSSRASPKPNRIEIEHTL